MGEEEAPALVVEGGRGGRCCAGGVDDAVRGGFGEVPSRVAAAEHRLEAANDVGAGRARADAPTRAELAEIDAGLGEGVRLHGGDGGEAANLTRLTRLGADVETKMRYAAADATGGSTGRRRGAPRARGQIPRVRQTSSHRRPRDASGGCAHRSSRGREPRVHL